MIPQGQDNCVDPLDGSLFVLQKSIAWLGRWRSASDEARGNLLVKAPQTKKPAN